MKEKEIQREENALKTGAVAGAVAAVATSSVVGSVVGERSLAGIAIAAAAPVAAAVAGYGIYKACTSSEEDEE